jgi:hypothetical protein
MSTTKTPDEVNIHRPAGVNELKRQTVNLRFLTSLIKDWNIYFINNSINYSVKTKNL